MAFAEDLSPFFATADFAVTATWKGSTAVAGLFDNDYVSPFGEIEANAVMFTCPLAACATVAHGDAFVVNGASYTVAAVAHEYDLVRLKLRRT